MKFKIIKVGLLILVAFLGIRTVYPSPKDSLLRALQKHPANDTVKANLLIEIARTFYEKDPDSMVVYISQAEILAKKLNYKKGLATAYNLKGISYYRAFKYREAFEFYNKVLPLLNDLKDTVRICKVYGNLRLIFEAFEDFSKQLEYSLKINELARKSKNPYLQVDAYLNLAFTYYSQKKYQTALKYLGNALEIAQKNPKELVKYDVMNYYGSVLQETNHYQPALLYLTQALEYYQRNDILYYDQANCANRIGIIYCALGDKVKAKLYLAKSQKLALQINAPDIVAENYLGFARLDSMNSNFKNAFKNYQAHINIKEKLADEQKSKQMLDLRVWYETDKAQKEKDLLLKEEQRQNAVIQRQYLIIISLVVVLSLVLLIVGMKVRQHRRTHAMNVLLEKQKLMILEKNKDMEYLHTVKDKLFSVISHDLRGPIIGVQNLLTLLTNYQLNPEKVKTLIESVQDDITETSDLLNNLLQWSRIQMKGKIPEKTMVAVLPLLSEIVRQNEGNAETKRIIIENRFSLNITILCDAEMLKIVTRNLLTNAIKFSFPDNKVVIDGKVADNFLVISVQDFGTGISPEHQSKIFSLTENVGEKGTLLEASTGLGLILCHDFIVQNGGKIWFETEPEQGTTFFFSLPVDTEDTKPS